MCECVLFLMFFSLTGKLLMCCNQQWLRRKGDWLMDLIQVFASTFGRNFFHTASLQTYHLLTQALCSVFLGGFIPLPALKWGSELQTQKWIQCDAVWLLRQTQSPGEVWARSVQGEAVSHAWNQKLFQRQQCQAHSCDKHWNAAECHWGARCSVSDLHDEWK